MLRAFGLVLLPLLSAAGSSQASGFTENGLSLLSFQLCNFSVTRQVPRVEAVRTPHLTYAPCGGWIPWRRCPKTVYRTRYQAVGVPESRHVTDCCEGFEQLGLYCVLPLNRSLEFTSRPGVCPMVGRDEPPTSLTTTTSPTTSTSPIPCFLDMDCPGLWKCCPFPGGPGCVAPKPAVPQGTPGTFWFNVTILVKMGFRELRLVDPQLLSHWRLLHSMVTSALWPRNCSVHPLTSASGDPSTTMSRLLLGLGQPMSVSDVSAVLDAVVKRVYEVIRIGVQDVDECLHEELHVCADGELCVNSEGTHHCQSSPGPPRQEPEPPRPGSAVTPLAALQSPLTLASTPAIGASTTHGHSQDTPISGPSPSHPWEPEAGQPGTPGALPGKGGGRNGTEQSVQGTAPSGEPGVGTSQAAASSRALGPALGSVSGVTGSPRGPTLWLSPNATLESPLWPPVTEGPTGYQTWHPSWPTWAPKLHDLNPGPSSSSDLSLLPTLPSQEPPGCVPSILGTVTISNVTSTSFHMAWAADLALHSTFQVTLTPPWGDPMYLETQDTSMTVASLQPGTLYLVEIRTRACGAESSRTYLRVRTAAHMLQGRVRVTNVEFTEALRDEDSEEYRAFLRLFLSTVREALPATVQGHMAAGQVLLRVTGLLAGSVVVDFRLLVQTALDVHDMAAAFLAAFHNQTLLEVAGEDTFIEDYDECAQGDHDCRPGTSCRNTLGSFFCTCGPGTPHGPVEHSGRPCEGSPPVNTTRTHATPPGTVGGPRASSVPSLAPRLSLSAAVTPLCGIQKVGVAIQQRFLRQESVPTSSLYLGHPSCGVSQSNSTHVLLVAGWTECGTVVQSNLTSTEVRTTLRSRPSPGGVVHHLRILCPVHCTFQNHLLVSSSYTPQWGELSMAGDLHGLGRFVTEMQVFVGDAPVPPSHSVSAREHVRVQVGLRPRQAQLRVVLLQCWATPGHDARDPRTFGFINNSCAVPNTHTELLENGGSDKARFRLKIFAFVDNPLVFLHCSLRVCLDAPGTSCRIDCNDMRAPRSWDGSATHQASWGPLVRAEGETLAPQAGPGSSSLVLAVVAAFAAVVGVAVTLAQHCRRVTGRYDLKALPTSFSQPFGGGAEVFLGCWEAWPRSSLVSVTPCISQPGSGSVVDYGTRGRSRAEHISKKRN
ncbi:uromodulin-like 1 [Suncus etruscus]|uniref:uromodulin-like 1 n=1 Tax=Suncus etruscus TaxID=109475 RepID=UPI0021105F0C|nr:uromodulin-like 1 [Suncus etruscus]